MSRLEELTPGASVRGLLPDSLGTVVLEPRAVFPKRLLGRAFPAEWQLGEMRLVPWRHREA